jgi:putative DNA primase/helicase
MRSVRRRIEVFAQAQFVALRAKPGKNAMKMSMRIKIKAVVEDKATREFFAQIKFRDWEGKYRKLNVPLADIADLKMLRKALTNRGCHFDPEEVKVTEALAKLSAMATNADRWAFAAAVGWRANRRQFVHPANVIGKSASKIAIKPPRAIGTDHGCNLAIRGSHKEWIEAVAMPARYSSRMVLGICAAFAAPLLEFSGLNSFAILVHGPGKIGKSTMLLTAASVTGSASRPGSGSGNLSC